MSCTEASTWPRVVRPRLFETSREVTRAAYERNRVQARLLAGQAMTKWLLR